MTAATASLALTELSRDSVLLADTRHRNARDGAWCEPEPPHVDGCTCREGAPRCDTCWRAWQHHVATTPAT